MDLLYFTNARSSFCRDIAVNCATTIERNPDALAPSASIPFIPQTERREILKIYGDAPPTVSVSTVAVASLNCGVAFKFGGNDGSKYVN